MIGNQNDVLVLFTCTPSRRTSPHIRRGAGWRGRWWCCAPTASAPPSRPDPPQPGPGPSGTWCRCPCTASSRGTPCWTSPGFWQSWDFYHTNYYIIHTALKIFLGFHRLRLLKLVSNTTTHRTSTVCVRGIQSYLWWHTSSMLIFSILNFPVTFQTISFQLDNNINIFIIIKNHNGKTWEKIQ